MFQLTQSMFNRRPIGAGVVAAMRLDGIPSIPGPVFNVDLTSTLHPAIGGNYEHIRGSGHRYTDYDSKVKALGSGEAGFDGARLVKNLYDLRLSAITGPPSAALFDVEWDQLAPDGTYSMARMTCTSSGTLSFLDSRSSTDVLAGDACTSSLYVRYKTGTPKQLTFKHPDFTGSTNITPTDNDWHRYSFTADAISASIYMGISGGASIAVGDVIEIYGFQFENLEYEASTLPSEYVNTRSGTGTEDFTDPTVSSTSGWAADGGWSVPTGSTPLQWNRTGLTNGYAYAKTTDSISPFLFPIGLLTNGRDYEVRIDLENIDPGAASILKLKVWLGESDGTGSEQVDLLGLTGSATVWFNGTANTTPGSYSLWVELQCSQPSGTSSFDVVGISIKEIEHGDSYCDRKWFTTENGNSVLNNVVTEQVGTPLVDSSLAGFTAWGPTSNLCTWSTALATASQWQVGGGLTKGSAVASPSGDINAAPLIFAGAAGDHLLQSGFTSLSTSTVYTMSIWARVASGTSTFELGLWGDVSANQMSGPLTVNTTWQRFDYVVTTGASDTTWQFRLWNNQTTPHSDTIEFWGYQVEQKPYATPFVEAGGGTTQRFGHTLDFDGDSYSETGALYVEFEVSQDVLDDSAASGLAGYEDASATSDKVVLFIIGGNNRIRANITGSGGFKTLDSVSPLTAGRHKALVTWEKNGAGDTRMHLYVDGTASTQNTDIENASKIPNPANIDLLVAGRNENAGSPDYANCNIRRCKTWGRFVESTEAVSETTL